MTQSEYEERLRRLEEKRRAGIALVEAAYRAEVAALEVFTKDDVTRKLGDAPNRSSVFRILDDLVHEGRLKVHSPGSGRLPTEYRRVQRDSKA